MSRNYFQHSTNYKTINGLSNLTSFQSVNQSLIPSADITYDIGAPSLRWQELYAGAVYANEGQSTLKSVQIADGTGAQTTISGGNVSTSSSVTATQNVTAGGTVYTNSLRSNPGGGTITCYDNLNVLGTLSYSLPPAATGVFGTLSDTEIGDLVTDPVDGGEAANSNLQPAAERVLSAPTINATQWISTPFLTLMGLAQTDKLKVTSNLVPSSKTDYNNSAFWNEGGAIIQGDTFVAASLIPDSLSVVNNTVIGGSLEVQSVANSTTPSTGALVVAGGAGIGNALRVGGNTVISGATTLSSTLGVTGNSTMAGTLQVTNNTASSSTSTGAVVVTGGLGVGGAVNAASASVNTLTVDGGTNTANTIKSTLVTGITDSNFRITGAKGASGSTSGVLVGKVGLNYGGTGGTNDNAYVKFYRGGSVTGGYLGFSTDTDVDRMIIDSAGVVSVSNTTEATSTSAGSVVLQGGLAAAKRLYSTGVTSVATGAASSTTAGPNVFSGGIACNNTSYFTSINCSTITNVQNFVEQGTAVTSSSDIPITITTSAFLPNVTYIRSPLPATGSITDTTPTAASIISALTSAGITVAVNTVYECRWRSAVTGTWTITPGTGVFIVGQSSFTTAYPIAQSSFVVVSVRISSVTSGSEQLSLAFGEVNVNGMMTNKDATITAQRIFSGVTQLNRGLTGPSSASNPSSFWYTSDIRTLNSGGGTTYAGADMLPGTVILRIGVPGPGDIQDNLPTASNILAAFGANTPLVGDGWDVYLSISANSYAGPTSPGHKLGGNTGITLYPSYVDGFSVLRLPICSPQGVVRLHLVRTGTSTISVFLVGNTAMG